jgi:hypothetical protein
VAEGLQSTEERGSGSWPEAGGNGKKTLQPGFYVLDDPLEAAVFSALVEIMKELSDRKVG